MKKGEIVLISFPFTDLSGVKLRPAVILANKTSDVIVAFLTTNTKYKDHYDIKIKPNKINGLKKFSILKISKIMTLHRELIMGKIGNINKSQIRQINVKLVKLFNILL